MMGRKREASPWAEGPGWMERDMGAVMAHLREAFDGGRGEVPADESLPDGREIGAVAARACLAARSAGGVPHGFAADVAVTLGTLLDNGHRDFRAGDHTESYGSLAEAARSASPEAAPRPAGTR